MAAARSSLWFWIASGLWGMLGLQSTYGQVYAQYQSLQALQSFYDDKVINDDLYQHIGFVDGDSKPKPLVELYHESDVWQISSNLQLGSLRTGGKINFDLASDPDVKKRILAGASLADLFTPSDLSVFVLVHLNFASDPNSDFPVLTVPFPYITSTASSEVETLPGAVLQLGNPSKPTLQISYGHSLVSSQSSAVFASIDPINVFDVRMPYFGVFTNVFKQGSVTANSPLDDYRYGYSGDLTWLLGPSDQGSKATIYTAEREYKPNYVDRRSTTHLGAQALFGFIDLDYFWKDFKFTSAETTEWRGGFEFVFDGGDAYSSVYRTLGQFRGGLTYVNVSNTYGIFLLPAVSDSSKFLNTPGMGYYLELTLQNPLAQSASYFLWLLELNLCIVDFISGMASGDFGPYNNASAALGETGAALANAEKNGDFKGNVFDRLTFGYQLNDPLTVSTYYFAQDQGHLYVDIDIFF